MTINRAPAHLQDMLGFVRELRTMVSGLTEARFVDDRIRCLATEKLFINLGEAATRLGDFSESFPEIPWRRVIGLRNILAHGYETVAHEVLYRTIEKDLPDLEAALQRALSSVDPNV
jgi:uncharacterized protein with HEPN domain